MSQAGDLESEIGEDSQNFWFPKQYMKTVKRLENSHKLCQDLMTLVIDRAEIEKHYSASLKKWSSKWVSYLDSGAEYGTARRGWQSLCNEALDIADIHSVMRTKLLEETQPDIKRWQKEHYHKATIPTQPFKEVKALENEFEYTQKPWTKKLKKSSLCKKEYHASCKLEKSLSIQLQNAKNDNTQNPEQVKKLEEKQKKAEKEVDRTKVSYQASLNDLEGESGRYMEEMEKIFRKAQALEQERIEYFKELFEHIRVILDISKNERLPQVYEKCRSEITDMNAEVDLKNWSMTNGSAMVFMMPQFEEYTAELSAITKKKNVVSSSGITLKNVTTYDPEKRQSFTKSNESLDDVRRPTEKPKLPSYDETMNPFNVQNEEPARNGNGPSFAPNSSNDSFYDTLIVDDSRPGVKVRALYDYKSQEEDELNLVAGELFEKLEEEDEQGWCKGRCNGVIGLYPANYADPV